MDLDLNPKTLFTATAALCTIVLGFVLLIALTINDKYYQAKLQDFHTWLKLARVGLHSANECSNTC